MKGKTFIIIMICLAVLGLAMPVLAEENKFSAVYASERTAVLATYVEVENGNNGVIANGTCFFVGEEGKDPLYLVTNHHVIEYFLSLGKGELVQEQDSAGQSIKYRCTLRVYYDSRDYEEAYVVAYDESRDLAILKLGKETQKRKPFALHIPASDEQASEVCVVGYPGIADNDLNAPISQWSMDDVSTAVGHITRMMTVKGTGVKMIITDAAIQSGNSGGPVVNSNNCVVGISTSTVSRTEIKDEGFEIEKIYYAVNVEEAIFLMDRYNIPYTTTGGKRDSTPLPSLVPTEEPASSEEPTVEPKPKAVEIPIGGILAGIVAAVLLIGSFIFIVRKKKRGVSVVEPEKTKKVLHTEYAEPTVKVRPLVRSLSPQHNDMKVSLEDGREICLGRKRDVCSIVYKEGTPGVSAVHCSLTFDSKNMVFRLKDLNSTYGTFLSKGNRQMKAGDSCILSPGDKFYLGDSNNELIVELA